MWVIQAKTSKLYYRKYSPCGVSDINEATKMTEEEADRMIESNRSRYKFRRSRILLPTVEKVYVGGDIMKEEIRQVPAPIKGDHVVCPHCTYHYQKPYDMFVNEIEGQQIIIECNCCKKQFYAFCLTEYVSFAKG